MTRNRLRRIWLVTHRWLGLTAGLLFVLIGLSGSLLVFQHTLDGWLNPNLLVTEPRESQRNGSQRTLQEIVAAAEHASPDRSARMQFVDLPRTANGVWTFWFQTKSKTETTLTQVYVDPYTAKVTGARPRQGYLMGWIYRLHTELLAGKTGETIVGIAGILLLVSVCSGVLLWWPLLKNSWRAALSIRSGRRFNYDLHKTTGIISAAFLLVVAFTGVYLIFPAWIKPGVTAMLPETSAPGVLRSNRAEGRVRIDADRAIAIARDVFPEGDCKRLHFPVGADGVYVVRVRQPGEVRRSSGNSRVWIDQYSGQVLAVRDWYQRTTADTLFAWQFPLHNGEAFGLTGRWIVLLTGVTLSVLYFTGVLIWWRKRQSRIRQRSSRVEFDRTAKTALQAVAQHGG